MGADLYLNSAFEPQRQKWEPKFEKAAAARDAAPDGPSREAAQQRVEYCYDQMFARGYFRDSYNDSNLLWKFGLSWWGDVIPMLDHSLLSPAQTLRLLAMMDERQGEFDRAVAALSIEEQTYFREKAAELRAFLREASTRGESIDCSL